MSRYVALFVVAAMGFGSVDVLRAQQNIVPGRGVVDVTLERTETAPVQEFSIENKVYDGSELVASSTTLLTGGRVYDFLVRPDETIILAVDEGRIAVLDNHRRVRVELAPDSVATFCAQLQQQALQSASESMRFFADPRFEERLDPETGELVLDSPYVEYRAKYVVPPDAAVLKQYERCLLWQSRLNVLVNPGAPPPLARMELNAALGRRHVIAEEVAMKRKAGTSGPARALRAEHRYTWRLDEPDRKRIELAHERWATYPAVSAEEFFRPAVENAKR